MAGRGGFSKRDLLEFSNMIIKQKITLRKRVGATHTIEVDSLAKKKEILNNQRNLSQLGQYQEVPLSGTMRDTGTQSISISALENTGGGRTSKLTTEL